MTRNFPFLLIVFLLSFNVFYAQKNNFNRYTVKNGLPQNSVYKIFQDSKGYLWFTTDGGGVAKFDGKKYEYLDKTKGLAGNVVRDIIEDSNGYFWFATDEGVSVYNGKTFKNYTTTNGLLSDIVFDLFEDSKKRIWAGTSGGGVSVFEKKDSVTVTTFTSSNGLASDNVFSILEDNFNRIWLGYIGGNPQIVNYEKELTVTEINTSFNYDLSTIFCGIKDSEGNIWYGSIKNGVFKYENISPNSNPNIVSYNILNGLKDNYILNISERNSTICIGTNDGGLHLLNGNQFEYIDISDGLPNNQIINTHKDKENNLWISCMGEGVVKLNGFNFSHFSKNDGLLSNQISHILKNELDSCYWVATYDKGIQVLSIENNKIIEKQNILSENPFYSSVRTFDFDNNNDLWIGTQNGIVVWNKKILRTVNSDENLSGDQINSIYCAKNDWVWIGTSSGLTFYNGDIYGVFTQEDGFIHNEIETIIEDKYGTIWIGTLGGLAKYKNNSMTTFDEEEGLTNLKVHSLVENKEGNILIGTYGGGVFMLEQDNPKKIKSILSTEDLTSSNIYSLSFLDDYILIVGTDKGMDKVYFNKDFTVNSVKHYNENNGFMAIENNLNSIFTDKTNNKVLLGTVNGLTVYQPSFESTENVQPSILLEQINLFNQKVDWSTYGEVNSTNLPINLDLPFNKNFITFNFTTIHFSNPENITYTYKLSGFKEEWYQSKSNELSFQGLEPNNYTLHVKSITENGEQSVPYSFSFTISPPFYKTWWFYSICIIFIAASIFIYIRVRLTRLKKEKVILEKTVHERTKEIVKQKDIIEEKNKEITDSITYAQRIQNAILPDEERLISYFKDYFVLFNPKDIVSGDFYWANQKNNKYYFMAADCTGHGVPGAIMSVIGHTSLETTLKHTIEFESGAFLDELTNNVVYTLQQSSNQIIKDGMDLALCVYNKDDKTIQYSGANNPLYIVRYKQHGFTDVLNENNLALENEEFNLFEIKADKQPIGHFEHRVNFKTHTINLLENDSIYMFSDGFADQFGGEKGKKYKYKPFKQLLLNIQKESMQEQKELLNTEINNWMQPNTDIHHEQIDDILVFGVKVI